MAVSPDTPRLGGTGASPPTPEALTPSSCSDHGADSCKPSLTNHAPTSIRGSSMTNRGFSPCAIIALLAVWHHYASLPPPDVGRLRNKGGGKKRRALGGDGDLWLSVALPPLLMNALWPRFSSLANIPASPTRSQSRTPPCTSAQGTPAHVRSQ